MKKINLSECFYSVQGEGSTIGQPKLFIRLSGCNLNCKFCDTKYHIEKNDIENLDHLLKKYKRWCITGGEPLLQQEGILSLIREYRPDFVEIETNGTIFPKDELLDDIDQWNISPKNPEYNEVKNIEYNFLRKIAENKRRSGNEYPKYIVKFVYNKDDEFIFKTLYTYMIPNRKVYIMTEGATKKEQEKKMKEVFDFCLEHNFNFSPRLHVLMFDDDRGV